jgi:hypothetical protein
MELRDYGWVVDGINLDRPNPARIYDYLLGGHHNFAADRAAGEKMLQKLPYAADVAVVLRAFLRRAIDLITAQGVDQFLDIGSGLPTMGNVHDMARANIPEARVVYVDIDPVVIAHSAAMLRDDPRAAIIEADVREPQSILEHPEVVDLLDFTQPLGLTVMSLMHYVIDDDIAYSAVGTLVEALPPGSYLAFSQALVEDRTEELVNDAAEDYKAAADLRPRRAEEIARFFDGLELLEPGIVRPPLWRPEGPDDLMLDHLDEVHALAGVARKP